ncbi:hypothetical protein GCM10010099_22530 [Streptomyces cinereus]|nr:hypothetical protein GCM10010099_22530 [Streptomyces cinereus]
MTAPVPSPRLSPTAGLMNALARHAIGRLTARCTELETELTTAREINQLLKGEAS